jgi:hypothetical protein
MLTGVTLASCAVDAQDRYLAALSGVAFLETKTGLQVIAASAGENALTRFGYDGALTELDTFRLSAHVGLHDLVATQTGLTALARWGNAVTIDANSFTADGQANLVALSDTASAVRNTAGLTLDTLNIADDATAPLGDVTALASLSDGRVIAGSAFDTGIALLDASGTVTDVALAEDGFWHNRVSAIETVQIDERDFAIIAASGSSSLSVFEVAGDELILTDHEWDNMMTRFSGVSELATLRIGDMTVVAAGGADAGLSLFELTGEGDLVHLRDIVDTHDTTLANISGLDMIAHGDGALLVASSERDNGLSLFEMEFEFEQVAPDIQWYAMPEIMFTYEQRNSGSSVPVQDAPVDTAPAWIADWAEGDVLM